jgi:hypothetical protein
MNCLSTVYLNKIWIQNSAEKRRSDWWSRHDGLVCKHFRRVSDWSLGQPLYDLIEVVLSLQVKSLEGDVSVAGTAECVYRIALSTRRSPEKVFWTVTYSVLLSQTPLPCLRAENQMHKTKRPRCSSRTGVKVLSECCQSAHFGVLWSRNSHSS